MYPFSCAGPVGAVPSRHDVLPLVPCDPLSCCCSVYSCVMCRTSHATPAGRVPRNLDDRDSPPASARSYQRTRLYTRIALGKARAMDVVSGESSGNFGQLLLLYPLLFWLQALQANIGISMMMRGYGALFSPEGWLVCASRWSGVLPVTHA